MRRRVALVLVVAMSLGACANDAAEFGEVPEVAPLDCTDAHEGATELAREGWEMIDAQRAAFDAQDRSAADRAAAAALRLIETHAILVLANAECFNARELAEAEQTLRQLERDGEG